MNVLPVSKKPREKYQSWIPSAEDIATLEGADPIPCQGTSATSTWSACANIISGRRGLLNLGQTCFLNVVLQCFVHNPLLRNYFLGDKHNSRTCKIEDCTCCEMDQLFTEVHPLRHIPTIPTTLTNVLQVYSSDNSPYGPISFLATTWRKSAELSGYAQQDAHEFFISSLNHIHSNSRGSTNVHCNCIIHSTFAGQLQSDVQCERCGNVTSTVDPMLDISLELKGKGGEIVSGENTLAACLRRCVACGSGGASMAQRTIGLRCLRSWAVKNTAVVNAGNLLMFVILNSTERTHNSDLSTLTRKPARNSVSSNSRQF